MKARSCPSAYDLAGQEAPAKPFCCLQYSVSSEDMRAGYRGKKTNPGFNPGNLSTSTSKMKINIEYILAKGRTITAPDELQ